MVEIGACWSPVWMAVELRPACLSRSRFRRCLSAAFSLFVLWLGVSFSRILFLDAGVVGAARLLGCRWGAWFIRWAKVYFLI